MQTPNRSQRARPPVWALLGACLLGALLLLFQFPRGSPQPEVESVIPGSQDGQTDTARPIVDELDVSTPPPNMPTAAQAAAPELQPRQGPLVRAAGLGLPTVDPLMRDLTRELVGIRNTTAASTPEAVEAWRTAFQQLVHGGGEAVKALGAFLAEKPDVTFDSDTARALGYRSARLAAFDALRQIGSPEAIGLLDQALGETIAPREVAALAFELDQLAPGDYREKALSQTRDRLTEFSRNQNPEVDVAPLFEVFQQYRGPSAVEDLEKAASRWNYYALSALANLPADAGVPSLVKMANPTLSSGHRLLALGLLAQRASSSQIARDVLVTQSASKQIPPSFWPQLSASLAGDEFYPVDSVLAAYPTVQSWDDVKSTHISFGNQNFYQLPSDTSLTADGLGQRTRLVSELMAGVSDPAALEALQQVQTTLQARLARLAAAPPLSSEQ